MRSIDELLAFLATVLDPAFDLEAAQRRFGRVVRWAGERGRIEPAPAAFRTLTLESSHGAFAGIQARLAEPLAADWDALVARLGPGRDLGGDVDDWGGPRAHAFRFPDSRRAGDVVLYAHVDGGTALISRVIARRRLR